MRLIVTGGREYGEPVDSSGAARGDVAIGERDHVKMVLDRVHKKRPITRIVQGGAKGADKQARRWGHRNGVQVVTYEYPENGGRAGGPERNAAMVHDGADGAVAFPGGRGTDGCVEMLQKAGIKVLDERKGKP